MTLDWRKICKAYIRHVIQEEGVSFLNSWRGDPNGLNEEEAKALRELDAKED